MFADLIKLNLSSDVVRYLCICFCSAQALYCSEVEVRATVIAWISSRMLGSKALTVSCVEKWKNCYCAANLWICTNVYSYSHPVTTQINSIRKFDGVHCKLDCGKIDVCQPSKYLSTERSEIHFLPIVLSRYIRTRRRNSVRLTIL